jgi:ElaB/YqjD/DUF883 family membrane-anchored ribosome-binding protein
VNYQLPNSPLNRLEAHWPRPGDADAPAVDARQVAANADAWRRRIEQFLGDHPQATVIVAAAIGAALGWLVKRK